MKIECLEHEYPDGTRSVCGLTLKIREGESVVVLGPNGSGKTTLLHHVIGLLEPKDGYIEVLGHELPEEVHRVRERMGVVFQDVDDQLIMPSVLEDVAFGLVNQGVPRREAFERAERVLRELGIEHLRDRPPQFLSGGQKKLVALAGAVVTDPDLLVLDEPTSGLDYRATRRFVRLISELKERMDFTLILTTFDVDVAAELADRVVVLKRGNVVADGPPRRVLTDVDLMRSSGLKPPEHVELLRELGVKRPPLDLTEAKEVLRELVGERLDGGP
ncbi:energy-coupling factor ABC transporter ATP-binding protein [Methanopyrus sp.]